MVLPSNMSQNSPKIDPQKDQNTPEIPPKQLKNTLKITRISLTKWLKYRKNNFKTTPKSSRKPFIYLQMLFDNLTLI